MNLRMVFGCLLAAAMAAAAAPARADSDAVHFGSDINVPADMTVHDAVCFFCSVNVDGKVNGDVVAFFGHVHITGEAHHDVVNFFGGVTADDGATIGQDLVSFFGGVRLGENTSVGHDMVVMVGGARLAKSAVVGHDSVVQPGWVLDFPLILLVGLFIFAVYELRAYRRRQYFRQFPFPPPHP
jgi:carbonic anhydrase/acetyltransferase-like protein (isoleucine patch superfamily)